MITSLSGLTVDQLSEWLQAIRRVAALDDATALREVDTLAWGLAQAVQGDAGYDFGAELGRNETEGRARLQRELEAARANLAHSERIAPFDAMHLRQSAAIYGTDESRAEVNALAADLEMAFHTAAIGRVLQEPIASTASLRKQLRILEYAASELAIAGRLTPELEAQARAGRERLARFRSQKKLDDAAVAQAGGNAKKAAKLRAEAGVVLAQDWASYFLGDTLSPPEASTRP